MIASDIITTIFETYVDDTTELSSAQELALLNRIYKKILRAKPWEFLKKNATGTATTTAGVTSIPVPSDFSFFSENNQMTDNTFVVDNNASPKVIFMGSQYTPYQIINYADRRQYRNRVGYAYLDLVNNKIVFTVTPVTDTLAYDFDYIYMPADLALSDAPVGIPSDMHHMIGYGMAVDEMTIQIFDRAKSYAVENQAKFDSYMRDLAYYNSQLRLD